MIERAEVSTAVLAALRDLADTPFEFVPFDRAWRRLGWERIVTGADSFGFQLSLPHDYPLHVDPLGERIVSAWLPVCYLDAQDGSVLAEVESAANRATFDAAFADLRDQMTALAGPPAREWLDQDERQYRAAVWGAKHGIVVVQQASFDDQFGDAVGISLDGLQLTELVPSTPFVQLLRRRSERLHDALGFPPLPDVLTPPRS